MLSEHVLNSLAVIPYLHGSRCLDIGTGAGIPGLILAMALPEIHWTLIDSNGKKIRFLRQVQLELKLPNLEIIQQRIEEYAADRVFSTIVCRAWCSLADFYRTAVDRLDEGGVLLAMKPGEPGKELNEIAGLGVSARFHALTVPGLEQKRGLVIISKTKPS